MFTSSSSSPAPLLLKKKQNNNSYATSSRQRGSTGRCCSGLLWDDLTGTCRCLPGSFGIQDGNYRSIDIPASFSPQGLFTVLWKVGVLTLNVTAFALTYGTTNPKLFYFAYATHWALLLSIVYSSLSVVNSVYPLSQPATSNTKVGWRCRLTWVVFLLSANSELLVSALYWTAVFVDPSMFYDGDDVPPIGSYLTHGGVCAAIWLDGFVISSIPIRLRHYFETTVWLNLTYLLWSYIHSGRVLGLGNPDNDEDDNDPTTNDDAIYDALVWTDNPPLNAILVSILAVLVVSPFIHILMYGWSKCGRRYINVNDDDVTTKTGSSHYVQMGGAAATVKAGSSSRTSRTSAAVV